MKKHAKKQLSKASLDTTKTIAQPLFIEYSEPEEIIANLIPFIYKKGPSLPFSEFDEVAENIWVHKTASLSSNVKIDAPAIICSGAKLCHGAHVRASVIGSFVNVGDNCHVVGSVVFDRAKLNFSDMVCGSIIGHGARIASCVSVSEESYFNPSSNGRIGSVIGDFAHVGACSVVGSGIIIDEYATVPPLSTVCKSVKAFSVFKGK